MIKLYTPEQWYKLFNYPSIIIEDDGMIYSEADYHKNFRNPLGKIDYEEGYIYGSDYHRWPRYPIGQIRVENGITRIYGEDYHRMMARPLYHIRDGRVYKDDEFYKLFPDPTYYVDDKLGNEKNNFGSFEGSTVSACKHAKEREEDSHFIRNVMIVLAMIAVSVVLWKGMYIDSSDFKSQFLVNIICTLVGGVITFLAIDKETKLDLAHIFIDIVYVFFISTPMFWLYTVFGLILDIGFDWRFIGMSFLAVLVTGLMNLAPSIVVGTVVGLLSKLKTKNS